MEAAAAQQAYPYLTSSTYTAALEFAIALRQSIRRAPLPKDFNLKTLADELYHSLEWGRNSSLLLFIG